MQPHPHSHTYPSPPTRRHELIDDAFHLQQLLQRMDSELFDELAFFVVHRGLAVGTNATTVGRGGNAGGRVEGAWARACGGDYEASMG